MVYRTLVHLHIMSLAPALVFSQICFCGAPLSSKPLFIISRWCTSLRCYRNNPIKWTAGEVDRLSERLLNRCLSGHREAMVMTAGLDSCSRGTRVRCPLKHTHTITHPFETLYDANVQISTGGPYGNLSHLSQTNSLRTGVKHSRLCCSVVVKTLLLFASLLFKLNGPCEELLDETESWCLCKCLVLSTSLLVIYSSLLST